MKVKLTDWGWCTLKRDVYVNRRLALVLWKDGPIATLTVNCPEIPLLPGEFCVKTWSENEQIAQDCMESGLFVDTGARWQTGFVEVQIWRFA